jgi:cytohesin
MLSMAARFGHDIILQALLEAGANPNVRCKQQLTALHYAIQGGEVFSTKTLLRYGADPSAKDEQGWMPLHHAAWDGAGGCVEHLVKAGADVNARVPTGESALQIALERANVNTARALVSMGADVKVKWAKSGATTLMLAMELKNSTELVKQLLVKGVDVNAVPKNGLTAFYTAVAMDDVALMELLVQYGAKINEPSSKWKTALEVARQYKASKAQRWLEAR